MFETKLINKKISIESFTVHAETEEQQRTRFQVELEFIQCLANPNYLHCECVQ